jgi:aminoglycoside 6'-N-acetyltransferase
VRHDDAGALLALLTEPSVARWWHAEYRHAALDVTLAGAHQGCGLGPEALRLVIRHLIEQGHHRFTIDPAVANERAIRAYAKLGFKPVGVMRAYELGADGTWHDGLLMDLLAGELL